MYESRLQRVSLVVLRTLVGWHFLYEGFYKVIAPSWSREGVPLGRWTSAGYLKGAAAGPFAGLFHRLPAAPRPRHNPLLGLVRPPLLCPPLRPRPFTPPRRPAP